MRIYQKSLSVQDPSQWVKWQEAQLSMSGESTESDVASPGAPSRPSVARERVALTIAGSDSSGGAGIQADLKTFSALGVYGASVVTALTAQNTTGVQAVHTLPGEFVLAQIDSVISDLNIRAIKTGMLANAEIIAAVCERIGSLQVRVSATANAPNTGASTPALIVDPVMIATSGDPLISDDAIELMRDRLAPMADLLTPNLNEAAALLETGIATSRSEMQAQGRELVERGCRAVLMKGGHFAEDGVEGTILEERQALDVLVTEDDAIWLHAPWVDTCNTHGTGCTLSAAIAANVVLGEPVFDAVTRAKWFLSSALDAASTQRVGAGAGPVDHLHEIKAWTTG